MNKMVDKRNTLLADIEDVTMSVDSFTSTLIERIAGLEVINKQLLDTCRMAQRLYKEALPKFDWGASALDSNAIRILNETDIAVGNAIVAAEKAIDEHNKN